MRFDETVIDLGYWCTSPAVNASGTEDESSSSIRWSSIQC